MNEADVRQKIEGLLKRLFKNKFEVKREEKIEAQVGAKRIKVSGRFFGYS